MLDDGGLHAAPMPNFERDDPVKRIVSAFQSNSVRNSIIDGQLVMLDGKLLTMDEDQILADANKAWNNLAEKAAVS